MSVFIMTVLALFAPHPAQATEQTTEMRPLWSYQAQGRVSNAVVVASDPARIAFSDMSGKLSVLNVSDGSRVWSYDIASTTMTTPASADLDGDGTNEIIVADADGMLHCLNHDGTLLWRRHLPATVKPYSGLAAADLDGDGNREIVCTDDGGNVTCLDKQGNTVWQWATHCRELGSPLLADADGDGRREVFFTAHDFRIFAVSSEGRLLWFRYVPEDMFPNSVPTLGDLNGDGAAELYVGGGLHHLYALNPATGDTLWSRETNTHVNNAMVVGDIDGDSSEEVVVGVRSGTITCYSAGGETKWSTHIAAPVYEAPLVADLTGDGRPENLWLPVSNRPALIGPDGSITERLAAPSARGYSHPLAVPVSDQPGMAVVVPACDLLDHVKCFLLPGAGNTVVYGGPRGDASLSGDYVPRTVRGTSVRPLRTESSDTSLSVQFPSALFTGRNDVSFTIGDETPRTVSFYMVIDSPAGRQFIYREAYPAGATQTITFNALAAGTYRARAYAVSSGGNVKHLIAEASWELEPFTRDLAAITQSCSEIEAMLETGNPLWSGAERQLQTTRRTLETLRERCTNPPAAQDDLAALADDVTEVRQALSIDFGLIRTLHARVQGGNTSSVVSWRINPWKIFSLAEDTPPDSATVLRVAACRGENESVRLALFNTAAQHVDARVVLSDLTSETAEAVIPHDAVNLFRVVNVPAHADRLVDDALAPLGPAQIVTLPSWSSGSLWLTVSPGDAPAGVYNGTVTVQPLVFGAQPEVIPVELTVYPVQLPEDSPLNVCMWTVGNESFLREYQEETLQDLISHRYNVFASAPVPTCPYDSTGAPTGPMDYTHSDAAVRRLAPHGTLLFAGPQGGPRMQGVERFSPVWQRAYRHYITHWMAHLDSMGVGRDNFAFYPMDEPHFFGGSREQIFLQTAQATRQVDPTIRLYTNPTTGTQPELIDQFEPWVDIWCPSQELLNRSADWLVPRLKATGAEVWHYDAPGKAKMLSSLHHQRHQAWQAWMYGFTGIGYWVYAHHTEDVSRWMSSIYAPPDFFCTVYEGRGPIPSRRWESMREGIEDWLLLNELRKATDTARAAGIRSDALTRADYLLNEMPQEMADKLRRSGRYLHRPASPTALDEVVQDLDRVKREIVQEIIRLRSLTADSR